jgi:hypothetical protein
VLLLLGRAYCYSWAVRVFTLGLRVVVTALYELSVSCLLFY